MPEKFSDPELEKIAASLFELRKKHDIPFFVFSTGTDNGGTVKKVVTFTGAPDERVPVLFNISIDIDTYD